LDSDSAAISGALSGARLSTRAGTNVVCTT